MRIITIISLTIAAITCAALPGALGQTTPPDWPGRVRAPLITTGGRGEVAAAPDRAVVRLGAEVQAREAGAAQSQLNEIMQRALKQIQARNIPEEQIQTVGLSLSPVYSTPERTREGKPSEPRIVAYRAANTVKVVVDDMEKIGDVVDAGISAGANRLEGISFEIINDTQLRAQALRLAVQDARGKAEAVAAAAGVRIVAVSEISEGGVETVRPPMHLSRAYAMDEAATPIQPGQIRVQASVTASYQIENIGVPQGATEKGSP